MHGKDFNSQIVNIRVGDILNSQIDKKLKPTMLDPSLLCRVEFWEVVGDLKEIFPKVYFPMGITEIKDREFRDFYGIYLPREKILSVEEVVKRSHEAFNSFHWEKYSREVPEQLSESFEMLRLPLEDSHISLSIQRILLDEFVFLVTQSSILSRLKKTFKLLEHLRVMPLLNLEETVPEEWRESLRGVKWMINFVNWIALIGGFSLFLGPVASVLSGVTIKGIRLVLIDP